MNPHASRAAEIEAAFLAGAETNLNLGKGAHVPGTRWSWRTQTHEDRLRDLMTARRQFDRQLLRSMPRNTTRIITGTQPRWFFGQRRAGVAMASCLSPLEHYFDRQDAPPPVGLAALLAHVKELVGEADVPHLLGICSPTGFSEEVKRGGIELPNVSLVLIEPRPGGGWNVIAASPAVTPPECRLFDPEAMPTKIQRVREEVDRRSADLLTGGLSAAALGAGLGLPTRMVVSAFDALVAADPELKVSRQRKDVLLYRGAPAAAEDNDMSMVQWLRQLFSREGNEARKINALSERRAKLTQRRERLYADVGQLEAREADLLKQGRETSSPAVKRRVAAQIKQLRDDMGRLNATARMIGQQVEVISTHVHNLTLVQQGQQARLPTSEEMTQDAVRAEEMLEQLSADVQLAGSLGMGVGEAGSSEEELAILKELETPSPAPEKTASETGAAGESAAAPPKQRERPQPEAG